MRDPRNRKVRGLWLHNGRYYAQYRVTGEKAPRRSQLGEVLVRKEIKAVGADRAYDSDAIRAMIAAAGKEAVSPLRSNRVSPPGDDKEKYKARNKAGRLFRKLKGYRGVATRYDKLASMFLGGAPATLLAVSLKCIVNTPWQAIVSAVVIVSPRVVTTGFAVLPRREQRRAIQTQNIVSTPPIYCAMLTHY